MQSPLTPLRQSNPWSIGEKSGVDLDVIPQLTGHVWANPTRLEVVPELCHMHGALL